MADKKYTYYESGTINYQKGFSLFELIVVVIIIALLLYVGISKYDKPIEKAVKSAIGFQAATFARMVSTINGSSEVMQRNSMDLKGVIVYLNEYGWPANTDPNMSPLAKNQTPEECQQLWNAFFQYPPSSTISFGGDKNTADYRISSINGRICRYELTRKQEGVYFFDYYLETGEVIPSSSM